MIEAAQLGLSLDTNLQHAYLVPFKDEVQLMPGYRGLLKLAKNSGELAGAPSVRLVFKGDHFLYRYGTEEMIVHEPKGNTNQDEITHVYAVIRFRDGSNPHHEVMTIDQIDAVMKRSQAYRNAVAKNRSDSPWHIDKGEMARKTVLKRALKVCPLALEPEGALTRALAHDEAVETGTPQSLATDIFGEDDIIDVKASKPVENTVDTLKAKLGIESGGDAINVSAESPSGASEASGKGKAKAKASASLTAKVRLQNALAERYGEDISARIKALTSLSTDLFGYERDNFEDLLESEAEKILAAM